MQRNSFVCQSSSQSITSPLYRFGFKQSLHQTYAWPTDGDLPSSTLPGRKRAEALRLHGSAANSCGAPLPPQHPPAMLKSAFPLASAEHNRSHSWRRGVLPPRASAGCSLPPAEGFFTAVTRSPAKEVRTTYRSSGL